MSDFAQYPYEVLQRIGSEVTRISDVLDSRLASAFEVDGLASDQARIGAALDHFSGEWEPSLKKLGENIGGFGDISIQLGAISAAFDRELAKSLDPGSQGGRVARGRAV